MLLERQPFPRFKVCGACLNRAAQGALAHAGLGGLVARAGAPPLTEVRLTGWGRTASVTLHGSVALSREAMDQALVRAAVDEGVVFVHGASASLGTVCNGARTLEVRGADGEQSLRARVVVSATGPPGPALLGQGRPCARRHSSGELTHRGRCRLGGRRLRLRSGSGAHGGRTCGICGVWYARRITA